MATDNAPPKQWLADTSRKLGEHFSSFQGEAYGEGWSDLWNKGDYLPWDKGAPNPALIDTLAQRHDLFGGPLLSDSASSQIRKKALVPGCGRGVDVLLLASFGYDAYGLEYSESAVEACQKHLKEHGDDEVYAVKDKKMGKGDVRFVRGDFYKDDFLGEMGIKEGKFDLIYDYTFFCAMSPAMRPHWALRMSQLLKPSAQGALICLEFPTQKDASTGGPPFASPSEAYLRHLSNPGEKVDYNEDGSVDVKAEMTKGSEKALVRVAHWTPERTHEVGKDNNGRVNDFVAVWRLGS